MWTTCFAGAPCGAIDSTTAIGPSSGRSSSIPHSSASSRLSACRSVSPASTPPPGSIQYSLPGFSCRMRRIRPSRRRTADTLILGSITRFVTTRSRARLARLQLVHLADDQLGNGQDDELGDSLARLGNERLLAVGVQQHDLDLAAMA